MAVANTVEVNKNGGAEGSAIGHPEFAPGVESRAARGEDDQAVAEFRET